MCIDEKPCKRCQKAADILTRPYKTQSEIIEAWASLYLLFLDGDSQELYSDTKQVG